MTSPVVYNEENFTHITLKGRKKRIPKNYNYRELFNTNTTNNYNDVPRVNKEKICQDEINVCKNENIMIMESNIENIPISLRDRLVQTNKIEKTVFTDFFLQNNK